jgi:hypothetical protein
VGTVTVTATIADGTAAGTPYIRNFSITITSSFVPVTNITGIPTSRMVGTLILNGTVVPSNATNQTIVWKVKNKGGTGASITGNTLATTIAGTVTVTATIADGTAAGTPYTQDFDITITSAFSFTTPVQYREMSRATPDSVTSGIIIGDSAYSYRFGEVDYKGVFIAGRTVTLSPFKIAKYETTYELWYEVKQWADGEGYTFANPGREDKDGSDGSPPTTAKTKPVAYISWRDAVVWCNAYSELDAIF